MVGKIQYPNISDIQEGDNEVVATRIILTHHETIDVLSVMPRRIMGPLIDPNLKWGMDGDECVICLEAMISGQEVSDLPTCNHTYISMAPLSCDLVLLLDANISIGVWY